MSSSVEFLTADVAISDRNNEINKWIEGTLLETIHVLNECVAICTRHYCKMSIYHTQREVVHVFGSETNEKFLLAQ